MGMYTEMHLFVELKKELRKDIKEWLYAQVSDTRDVVDVSNECPKELKGTRFETGLLCSSYYFDMQPVLIFRFDKISQTYFLTVLTNLKNYDREIKKFLTILEPYIDTYDGTHIGHMRYETYNNPTLLFMQDRKIVEHTVDFMKED